MSILHWSLFPRLGAEGWHSFATPNAPAGKLTKWARQGFDLCPGKVRPAETLPEGSPKGVQPKGKPLGFRGFSWVLGTTCRHMSSAHAIAEDRCREAGERGVNQKLNLKSQRQVVMVWGLKGRSPSPAPCYCEPRSGRNSNTGRLAKTINAAVYRPKWANELR